jgi:cell division protein FtsB
MLITVLFLLAPVSSFSETRQEQLYRLAGVKTDEQKAIDELTSESKKLREEINNLRLEIDLLQERLHIIEMKTGN